MGGKMTQERREAFYGLRTCRLSPLVLFPASEPASKRLVRAFPFSFRSGRTRKAYTGGRLISVVNGGIGAPSCEIICNLVCKGGAKTILRVDFCGALAPDIGVGDIFIARSARSFDQVTRHYSDTETVEADERLLSFFEDRLTPLAQKAGVPVHVGTICTVDLFFAQTDEMLRGWRQHGEAVDMETAAVYAISRAYDVTSLALMVVTDNKLMGELPYSGGSDNLKKITTGFELLAEAVKSAVPMLR